MNLIVGVLAMVVSVVLTAKYLRELWIHFTRPEQFDAMVKSQMTYGELGGKEVGRNDRLFFSYPFLIIGFGIGGWLLAMAL